MKLGEAIPKYQSYRNLLLYRQNDIYSKLNGAKNNAEKTGSGEWSQKAAELQLSFDAAKEEFEKYNEVLGSLREQWEFAANAENCKALADPETGMAATMSKIMKTVVRMCAGDKVPYYDEKKVMDYDDDLYQKAKMAQMAMAAMKEKQKEYDTLWDKEGGHYDPEGVANNTEAAGELPDIPSGGGEGGEAEVTE